MVETSETKAKPRFDSSLFDSYAKSNHFKNIFANMPINLGRLID